VKVRFARIGERAALEELQRRASLVYEDTREELLAHPEAIELPVGQIRARGVRVAERGRKVLGFAALVPGGRAGAAELDGLFVEPGSWRGGIGRLLVEDAARLARRRGYRVIDVIANPNALAFYEHVGFAGRRTVRTRFGPGIRMSLSVA
jgi:GNAT superfamily N-acetyltransferase